MFCSKNNKRYSNLKGIMKQPYLIWVSIHDMWSYFCIFTPCIKQYRFICSSPCSTNFVILVQATISKYYMCKVWKFSNEYFCMTSISNVLVFLNFVYNPMGTSSTGSTPTAIYILMHNFIISNRAGFNLSLLKRAKIIFNMIPNIPWYVKYFWCET